MTPEYKTRLIELGKKAQEALDGLENPMPVTPKEVAAMDKMHHLLGFISAIEQMP